MKFQQHYNRIERRTFTFNESEILQAMKDKIKATAYWSHKPSGATGERFEMEIDLYEGDDYKPSITVVQVFEYPVSVDAVDPQACSTGTPTTRVKDDLTPLLNVNEMGTGKIT